MKRKIFSASLLLLLSVPAFGPTGCAIWPVRERPPVKEGEDTPERAFSDWKRSISTAEKEREELRLLEQRFVAEGPHTDLLREYEHSLFTNEQLLGSALLAARRYATFPVPHKNEPLSQTLDLFLQIAGKSRYMGDRYQTASLVQQSEKMREIAVSICEQAGWAESGIPACRAHPPRKSSVKK